MPVTVPTTRPPLRALPPLMALLALVVLLLAGCSGAGDSDSSGGADDGAASDVRNGTSAEGAPEGSAADAPGTESGTDSDTAQRGSADDVLAQQPAIISKGTVTITAPDLDVVDRDLEKIVATHDGTTTSEESSTDDEGAVEFAQRVIRVPSAEFDTVVQELKGLGDQVEVDTDSEDVSTEVVDTAARVRAQERALQRMELLLDRAESLKDIISVESELTRRQADLDALKSRQAYLADQTSQSTLTIFLDRRVAAAKPEPKAERAAFVDGLADGWSALTRLGGGLAAVLGALLPFLVVLALMSAAVYVVLRVTRPARLRAEQRRRAARERHLHQPPPAPQQEQQEPREPQEQATGSPAGR